ncbi:hypothetical protein HDV06_004618 [Boothiomyces sp. JEL0866]|nr:hypothetical protein HDV06_004618 [Boothiomyces sp. JEL0866]
MSDKELHTSFTTASEAQKSGKDYPFAKDNEAFQESHANSDLNAKLQAGDNGSLESVQPVGLSKLRKLSSNASILKVGGSTSALGKYGSQRFGETKKSTLFNIEKSRLITTFDDDEDEEEDAEDSHLDSPTSIPPNTEHPKNTNYPLHEVSSVSYEGFGKSSDNMSVQSSINSQGKFIRTAYKELLKFYESSLIRKFRYYLKSITFSLIVNLVIFFTLVLFIIASTFLVPGLELPSFSYYNVYHIAFSLSGHMLFVATNSILKVIHQWILASQMASHGCHLNGLASNIVSPSTPGFQIRFIIKIIGFSVPVLISITAYFFQWTILSSLVTTDACIPATYPNPSNIIESLGNFLQGDTDLALVYSYAIPLEDGVIGGWSAWPLINPYSEFSMQGNGVGYAIGVECFPALAASSPVVGTQFYITSLSQFQNSVLGTLKVQVPQGSMILDGSTIDDTNGYVQECTFNIQFFEAQTVNSFQSDEWQMVAVQNVLSITVGEATVTVGTNKNRFVREFLQYSNTDKWNLASFYFPLVNQVFNSTVYYSSQGATFCNLLQWATLPDGYYHDSIMWKGIASALGTAGNISFDAAHYLVLQYDSTQTSTCEYYADHGAGYLSGTPTLITIVQIVVFILGGTVLLHIWWIYLIYGLDAATSLSSHTLKSNVRFAHDIHSYGNQIFAGSVSTLESFDEDLLKKIGDNKVFFGTTFESMNDDVPRLLLGPKKQIITVRKLLQRRKASHVLPAMEQELD